MDNLTTGKQLLISPNETYLWKLGILQSSKYG